MTRHDRPAQTGADQEVHRDAADQQRQVAHVPPSVEDERGEVQQQLPGLGAGMTAHQNERDQRQRQEPQDEFNAAE
jgi:hypothetical protein